MVKALLVSAVAVVTAMHSLAAEKSFKAYFAPRTAKAPVVDGRLDDACWATADWLDDYGNCTTSCIGDRRRVTPTAMKVMWDDNYLYLAMRCHEDTKENMESFCLESSGKGGHIHGYDVIELCVDGKNDEYTKHTAWLSPTGRKAMIWEYDFGYGLLTDQNFGTAADWDVKTSTGEDAKGPYWDIEARIALTDLEIVPKAGYMFGFEPARFRFRKHWYDAKTGEEIHGLSGLAERLQVLGWGTQGVWHKDPKFFGKCILVERKPENLGAGLRVAFPDLENHTLNIRGASGYLRISGGKTSEVSYAGRCKLVFEESRGDLKALDPVAAVADTEKKNIIAGVRKFIADTAEEIDRAEAETAKLEAVTAGALDKVEKDAARRKAAISAKYWSAVTGLIVAERKVRFPVKLDAGAAGEPALDGPGDPPRMDEWKDPTLVAWAKPAAAGRKRALVSVYFGDIFAVQHLMNRLDVDCDIFQVKYNRFLNTPQTMDKAKALERALARNDYDGFVFIGASPAAWPDNLRCRLAELQIAGKPVVLVNGSGWGSDFKTIPDFLSGAPQPMKKLVSLNARFRTGRPESDAVGAAPYDLFEMPAYLSAPSAGSFGNGRVVRYETEHPECSTYVVHPVWSPSYSVKPDDVFQDEYCQAYSVRVVMEGLGMRGPVTVKRIETAAAEPRKASVAKLVANAPADWSGRVRWAVRDNWGRGVVPAKTVDVSLKAGENSLELALPPLDPGRYSVDAVVLDGRGAMDFAAQYVTVEGGASAPRIDRLLLARECFEKDEPVEATVTVRNPEKGLKVTAEVRDPRLRIVCRADFPVDERRGYATVTFPADRLRLNCHFLNATLKNARGETLGFANDSFFRRIGDLEDIRVFDGSSNFGGKDIEPRLAIMDWSGLSVIQNGSRARLFYGNDPAVRCRIPGKCSYQGTSLNSPAYRKWLERTYLRHAENMRKRNGRFLSLGDDSGNPTAFDALKCDWVPGFFRRMKARYEARRAAGEFKGVEAFMKPYNLGINRKNSDFYWGFQIEVEKGPGLVRFLQSPLTREDLDDIRAAIIEAYDDIDMFNLQNGVKLASFEELTDAVIPTLRPKEKSEYPYFLRWLRTRYGDIAKLNAAWGADEKDFYSIEEKTIDELKLAGKWTAEIDKQIFLEDSFLEVFRIITSVVKEADPTIGVGLGASHLGNLQSESLKLINTMLPYGNVGLTKEDTEIGRSFGAKYLGETIGWYGTSFGSDETKVPRAIRERQVWNGLLTGCNFWWMWTTCYGVNGARQVNPGGFGYCMDALHEVRLGPGPQIRRSVREDDGVRLLYSRDSGHLAALKTEPTTHPIARCNWGTAIETLQLQYRHISDEQVAKGELVSGGAKVLVLPMADVISPAMEREIRAFVAKGGALIADFRPGLYSADGRRRGKGALDDLFAGRGRCTILDTDIAVYTARRGKAETDALRDRMLELFAAAGVKPQITVRTADGKLARGCEVTRFTRGRMTTFGVEKEAFALYESYPLAAKVELPGEAWVYDLRKGGLVAHGRSFGVSFEGTDEFVYTALPYEVKGVTLAFDPPKRGGTLDITAELAVSSGTPETHCLRVEFIPPDGLSRLELAPIPQYVEDAQRGRLRLRVPVAFNERDGFTVKVTDVASGKSAEKKLVFAE